MRLRCIKYEFDTQLIAQVNFYNEEVSRTAIAEVDLYDYLILDSFRDNSYKSPNVNEQSQSYYFEANGVSFSVSGAKDNDYLIGFFEINTLSTNYKWLLYQYDDAGGLIFSSIISKDNVSLSIVEDRDIDIQSTAYELEFKEWYSNVKLSSLTGWQSPLFVGTVPLFKFESLSITDILEKLFYSSFLQDILLENNLGLWHAVRYPFFFVGESEFKDNQIDLLSGYDSFVHQQLSCYEYLNSLCKCMGWKWFFYLGKLYIRNLYATTGDIIEIDYEQLGERGVIESGIENTFLNLKIDNVIIDNGNLSGGTDSTINFPWGSPQKNFYLGGDRKVVFSRDLDYPNLMLTQKKYRLVGTTGSSGFGYAGVVPPSSNMLRYKDEEFEMYRFDNIITEQLGQEPRSNLSTFLKGRTLEIKVACNTELVTRIDMHNTRFTSTAGDMYWGQYATAAGAPVTSEEDLQFSGNVGSMLYKFNTATNEYVTYQWYINESQEFIDNFSCYLGSDLLQLLRIKGDGIKYNPLNRYKIVNYPPDILNIDNKVFAMQELRFNQFENTFELKVIVK